MDPEERTDAPISDNIDPSHPVNVGDLQVFAEEVAAFVGRKIAEIPRPEVTLATKIDARNETRLITRDGQRPAQGTRYWRLLPS